MRWSTIKSVFPKEVITEYIRCFKNPETVRAACEDYRAAVTIDLEHDEEDLHKTIKCPLLILWSKNGFTGNNFDVLAIWRKIATNVKGYGLDCGHFLPEESPQITCDYLLQFFMEKK